MSKQPLGGAPDPPALTLAEVETFSHFPWEASWDYPYFWKHTLSSMQIEPLISKCLYFKAYSTACSFSALAEQLYPAWLVAEEALGIYETADPKTTYDY